MFYCWGPKTISRSRCCLFWAFAKTLQSISRFDWPHQPTSETCWCFSVVDGHFPRVFDLTHLLWYKSWWTEPVTLSLLCANSKLQKKVQTRLAPLVCFARFASICFYLRDELLASSSWPHLFCRLRLRYFRRMSLRCSFLPRAAFVCQLLFLALENALQEW